MSWKKTDEQTERVEFIAAWEAERCSFSAPCYRYV